MGLADHISTFITTGPRAWQGRPRRDLETCTVGSRRELFPCGQRTRFSEYMGRRRNRPFVRLKTALHYGEQMQVKPGSSVNDENRHSELVRNSLQNGAVKKKGARIQNSECCHSSNNMTEEPGKCGNSSLLLILSPKDSFLSRYSKYIAGVLGNMIHKRQNWARSQRPFWQGFHFSGF